MFQSLLENSHSELLESFPKQNYLKAKNFTLKGTAPGSFTADASPWWHPCVTLIRVGQDHQGLMGAGLHFLQIHIPEFLSLTFLFSVFWKDLEISAPQNASHASNQPDSWPRSQMEVVGAGWG